jgi:hypothetical protein
MPTGRNPDQMTAEEQRREIAGILAAGVLRAVRQSRRSVAADLVDSSDSRDSRLELRANSPLSVAPRTAG